MKTKHDEYPVETGNNETTVYKGGEMKTKQDHLWKQLPEFKDYFEDYFKDTFGIYNPEEFVRRARENEQQLKDDVSIFNKRSDWIIKQDQRIQQLEQDYEKLKNYKCTEHKALALENEEKISNQLTMLVDQENRILELREALRFYAEKQNWICRCGEAIDYDHDSCGTSECIIDSGAKAREALG